MNTNKVKEIRRYGQSIWLDFFDRKIISNGLLQKLIDEDGLSGITSNPSIFEKAVISSSDYDLDIRILANENKSSEQIFTGFAITDIRRAADILNPVFKSTKGEDGFVSMEVSPLFAYETNDTIAQAAELWKQVDRENLMIKIPATVEGVSAVYKCISEGININVTLLFGLKRYQEIVEAYISGLEERLQNNMAIDKITSVASFFLSRIDVLVDPLLDENGLNRLKGKVAIAAAKKAYSIYKRAFESERFKILSEKGGKPQKLLWASTGTKDPSYSDVKYVEALIGPKTINTLPLETIKAFRDHGNAASVLEDDLEGVDGLLQELKDNGIDLDEISQKLEVEGIKKFNNAYASLLKAIDSKKLKELSNSFNKQQ